MEVNTRRLMMILLICCLAGFLGGISHLLTGSYVVGIVASLAFAIIGNIGLGLLFLRRPKKFISQLDDEEKNMPGRGIW